MRWKSLSEIKKKKVHQCCHSFKSRYLSISPRTDVAGYKLKKRSGVDTGKEGQVVMACVSESSWTLSVSGAASLVVTATSSTSVSSISSVSSVSRARPPLSRSRSGPMTAVEEQREDLSDCECYTPTEQGRFDFMYLKAVNDFVPLPPASVQLSPQFAWDGLQMHEVTETSTSAFPVKWGQLKRGLHDRRVTPVLPKHFLSFMCLVFLSVTTHPISYWRQQASLKSVTGESSAWMGCPLNHRLLRSITAFSASSS